ncbi:unnamed protein product [Lactuca saligna]|uniref:Selenoprotein O n=1 Tax=Lactuca saligna TaxID=75948 RepID=A0AA35ZD88_LACSI|nr:unnamed protein product [Lactuca saligna]
MNVENVTNTIFPFGAQVNKNRSNVVSFVRLTLSDLLFIHLHLFHLLHRLPPPPPPPLLYSPSKVLKLHKKVPYFSTNASMESPVGLSVDSVADGLKKQSLSEDKRVKLNLEDLNWDHSFVRELPGDPRTDIMPREVLHACYSKVSPSVQVENPQLVAWSESVAEILDLDPKEFERPDFPLLFSGASPLAGGLSYAQCYGGHQFGMWAGQLGDGRAITLGELVNSKNERWELQLKGAGKTPYSRFADGLAVLRSSIREFLCSEAIHSLGIPTTRALSLVTTGKYVTRDMFYDGNPKDEPGAVVCRVSPSFLRFGSFQLHASRGKEDLKIVQALADYTIRHHFPHIENMNKSDSLSFSTGQENDSVVDLTSNKYAAWAVEVAERTASMIAKWQGVGFTHDLPGRRYCFANQPDVGLWNIAQFASTLSSAHLISEKESDYALERYGTKFMDDYQSVMTKKLGLPKYNKQLISKLLNNLAVDKVDYTNFFRLLSNIKADSSTPEEELLIPLKAALLDIGKERKEAWISWVKIYIEELLASGVGDEERKALMNSVNPKYILRNYLCQSAIDMAEQGDFDEVRRLLKVMERPYDEQPGMEKYARLPPAWAYRPERTYLKFYTRNSFTLEQSQSQTSPSVDRFLRETSPVAAFSPVKQPAGDCRTPTATLETVDPTPRE